MPIWVKDVPWGVVLFILGGIGYLIKRYLNKPTAAAELKGKEADIKKTETGEQIDLSKELREAQNVIRTLDTELRTLGGTNLQMQQQNAQEIDEKDDLIKRLENSLADALGEKDRFITAVKRLMEKAKIPLWITDNKGGSEYVGEQFYTFFRLTPEGAEDFYDRVVPADVAKVKAAWKQRLADYETALDLEFRMVGEDGEAIDVKSVYTFIRNKSGEPVLIIGLTIKR